ncbi:MAG: Purine-cytosine permease-like transporter [Firmicutes bacterium]|nr:Purine-cytosine permease-like transporter [Bacillota bacterium]
MSKKNEGIFSSSESAINAVPLDKRVNWVTPATIYAGCEFCIPVIMAGSAVVASFSLRELFWIIIVSLVIITWAGNSITSYLGAVVGRPSSVIARSSFGSAQARSIVSIVTFIVGCGWWALQTAVAGNAISSMFGIDYTTQYLPWAIVTIICGIIFAIPAVIGYSSMAWTDYIAVPGGLIILVWAFILVVNNMGWANVLAWDPPQTMSWITAVGVLLGCNVGQWLILADYSRYCKPTIKDNILMPSGIIVVGFVLFMMGGVLGAGQQKFDIVQILINVGFPVQAFLLFFIAQWTSQLVNNYTMGLSLCNLFNVDNNRGRAILTSIATVVGIIAALSGILNHFVNFLIVTGLMFPSIAAIMVTDFFIVRDKKWVEISGWNWIATISLIIGMFVAYYTQYIKPIGIPAVQCYIITGVVYYGLTYIKARISPDRFTPEKWLKRGNESVTA